MSFAGISPGTSTNPGRQLRMLRRDPTPHQLLTLDSPAGDLTVIQCVRKAFKPPTDVCLGFGSLFSSH